MVNTKIAKLKCKICRESHKRLTNPATATEKQVICYCQSDLERLKAVIYMMLSMPTQSVQQPSVVSQASAATPMAMLSTSARPTKAQEELLIVSNALIEDGAMYLCIYLDAHICSSWARQIGT